MLRYYDMTCVPKNGHVVKAVGRPETMGEKKNSDPDDRIFFQ